MVDHPYPVPGQVPAELAAAGPRMYPHRQISAAGPVLVRALVLPLEAAAVAVVRALAEGQAAQRGRQRRHHHLPAWHAKHARSSCTSPCGLQAEWRQL